MCELQKAYKEKFNQCKSKINYLLKFAVDEQQ